MSYILIEACYLFFFFNIFLWVILESMDAAPEVPHPLPTRLPACRTASAFFFFFFFSDSRRFGSICTDAARFMPNRLQFVPNRADSAKIGSYRPPAETGRKRPKSALNMAGKAETCILLSFFVNQGIVCVF